MSVRIFLGVFSKYKYKKQYWIKEDPCVLLSGYVTASQWSSAVESVLKLDVPWNMLRHQLAHVLPDGRIDYCSCLDQYVIETGLHKV